jgi:excisionase family DNA binding protein
MDERTADQPADSDVSDAADTWPLSAQEAAAVLGVSERTVRRAIGRGELPAVKRSGVYRIAPADLDRYRAGERLPVPLPIEGRPDPARLISLPGRHRTDSATLPRPLTTLVGRARGQTGVDRYDPYAPVDLGTADDALRVAGPAFAVTGFSADAADPCSPQRCRAW